MDKIAVLIPCFNEALTIAKVVNDFKNTLPNAKIYVYDNNSTDDTGTIAEHAGAIVRREYKQGKGNVMRRMFQDIDAECYIICDGDDTYPANDALEMSELVLEKKFDMVIGDRLSSTYFQENKRPFHNFGNSLVRAMINYIFKSKINDIMTGYRAFSYKFVKSFPLVSQGFEIETEMTIHAIDKNMDIANKIINYRDRPRGSESKLNTFADGIKIIKTIVHLFADYKPLQFFSLISLLLFLISGAFVLPVIQEYFETGLVKRFPTLIACGFGFMAAMISFFSGVILQTIRHKERREFEIALNQVITLSKLLP